MRRGVKSLRDLLFLEEGVLGVGVWAEAEVVDGVAGVEVGERIRRLERAD